MIERLFWKTCILLIFTFVSMATSVSGEVITDDFEISHDYLADGTAGTIWDGLIYNVTGGNATVQAADSNISNTGVLTLRSSDGNWENSDNDGLLLYKNVRGNFVAQVQVTSADNPLWNDMGLMARVANVNDAGPGEDYVAIRYFAAGGFNSIRNTDDGFTVNKDASGLQGFLQLERICDTFYFRRKATAGDSWHLMAAETRPDSSGLLLQVGIWQATFTSNIGTATFDNFSLTYLGDASRGDLNGDCKVDFCDLAVLAVHWLETGCGQPDWCDGVDLDGSTEIDFGDLSVLAEHWLERRTGKMSNGYFNLVFSEEAGGITILRQTGDTHYVNYILPAKTIGDLIVRYRIEDTNTPWQQADTAEIIPVVEVSLDAEKVVSYNIGSGPDMKLTERFAFEGQNLLWSMQLTNLTDTTIEIGDIVVPTIINTDYTGPTYEDTFRKRLNMHRFVAGHGSHIDWLRADGKGPHLVMTTQDGTKLEYFDRDNTGYIHSAVSGAKETRGTWRQEHTSILLNPASTPGDELTYGFTFRWADDYDGARDVLYANGGFDIHVVPGMVVPTNLEARFSLRTKNIISSVTAEYPDKTAITYLGENGQDVHIYKVIFSRLGENMLTINYGSSRYLVLEFFVTEPFETIFKKRANFIVTKQQHTDPSKWYNGLYSLWDMREKVLRSPDDTGGLMGYMVGGSDDPSTGACVYLTEKNLVFPDQNEINSLEYFIENFVWGKHQRTDTETPFPYGIYGANVWLDGCANWYDCRNSPYGFGSGGKGLEHMWRTYDYTHYIMLYYNMYRIAKNYPDMVNYLDAAGYLERAFGTAKAFYEVPYNIKLSGAFWVDWAYKFGNFHEKYIIDIIEALENEGRVADANWLRNEWEKKVKFFIYDDPYPYGSEFYIDRTAFESTHAVARYTVENPLTPDVNLWQDKNSGVWYSHPVINHPNDALDFMQRQLAVNIALRGWLETNYYHLGSALSQPTYNLCYMSQMAGWSILDYALYFANDVDAKKYTRLGYASIISSWALINTGTPEANYGYWYPGPENDGATGWAFKAEKYGGTWGIGEIPRGPWHYDGEINHGLAGGVNAAATVVVNDPIFGMFAYGGQLQHNIGFTEVIPRDGVRQCFHVIKGASRLHMLLDRDGFARNEPIIFNDSLTNIRFTLENRVNNAHTTRLKLSGLPTGTYEVSIDSVPDSTFDVSAGQEVAVEIPVGAGPIYEIVIQQQ